MLAVAALVLVALSVSGSGMPLAFAISDIVSDYGFGCGNRFWGIKDDTHNSELGHWFFGSSASTCTGQTIYYSRYNVAKVHTAMNTLGTTYKTAWEAAIQGRGEWGERGNPVPQQSNANFPASSTNNYSLEGQWLWNDDQQPQTTGIHAHFLTDLWFCKTGQQSSTGCNPSTSDYLVIDFMWMDLKNSGTNHWQQNCVSDTNCISDVSSAPGTQYSPIFCQREAGAGGTLTNVYHYNVILDNVRHGINLWADKTANINQYITDAFNTQYPAGACTHNYPGGSTNGHRGEYSIVDVESGIELDGATSDSGRVDGAYSFTRLSY